MHFFYVLQNGPAASLELDLEHYEVPTPTSLTSSATYLANLTETPRSLDNHGDFSQSDFLGSSLHRSADASVGSIDGATTSKVFIVTTC